MVRRRKGDGVVCLHLGLLLGDLRQHLRYVITCSVSPMRARARPRCPLSPASRARQPHRITRPAGTKAGAAGAVLGHGASVADGAPLSTTARIDPVNTGEELAPRAADNTAEEQRRRRWGRGYGLSTLSCYCCCVPQSPVRLPRGSRGMAGPGPLPRDQGLSVCGGRTLVPARAGESRFPAERRSSWHAPEPATRIGDFPPRGSAFVPIGLWFLSALVQSRQFLQRS
jgi:hypothetical protein